jgi:threonine synthase
MRFTDVSGATIGLSEAASLGLPASSGCFAPAGDGDLRPAVYAPEASFSETAAAAVAALFPEDIDPFAADRLSARAFPDCPPRFESDELVVVDLATGPSACGLDFEAAFLAGLLLSRKEGPRLLVADGSGAEGAALSEASAGARGLSLVLLYPEGAPARGVKAQRLTREGGNVRLVGVGADRAAIQALVREAASKGIAGQGVTAAGPYNPARFAARLILLVATFSCVRRRIASDLFIGVRGGDGLGFAACLWAWRLGLPLPGIVLSVSEKGVLGIDPSGKELVDRFDAERPGAIRSLTLLQNVDREAALRSRSELSARGGPNLDLASAAGLAAAERSLEAGLRGHARILVPRGADPRWEEPEDLSAEPPVGLSDARFDAEIEPNLAALERALTA